MSEQKEKSEEPCPEGRIRKDGKCTMPEVSFSALVMSLSTSALYHMGEIADPATGKTVKDLILAKHSIDTLNLLRDKTKGNLTDEEKGLLDNVLYDLRLRFVKAKS